MATFATLFDIPILHTFYTDGVAHDFVMEPTSSSARRMSGYHLVSLPNQGGLRILYPSERPGVSEIPFQGAVDLQFSLRLTNPYFEHFTALAHRESGVFYLYSNRNTAGVLELREVVFTTGALPPVRLASDERLAKLGLFNARGDLLADETVPVQDGVACPTLNLRGYSEGLYRLATSSSTNSVARWIYRRETVGTPWFALVDLSLVSLPLPEQDAPSYPIQFEARAAQWKYRILMKKPDQSLAYALVQADGPEAELHFSAAEESNLDDGGKLFEFVTVDKRGHAAQVPYRQRPRKNITFLARQSRQTRSRALPSQRPQDSEADNSGTPVLENLPSPSLQSAEPVVTIHA